MVGRLVGVAVGVPGRTAHPELPGVDPDHVRGHARALVAEIRVAVTVPAGAAAAVVAALRRGAVREAGVGHGAHEAGAPGRVSRVVARGGPHIGGELRGRVRVGAAPDRAADGGVRGTQGIRVG